MTDIYIIILAIVPRSHKIRLGDSRGAFSVTEPKLWNSLPITIRSALIISIFKSVLKTYLFALPINNKKKITKIIKKKIKSCMCSF